MKHIWTDTPKLQSTTREQRASDRKEMNIPARLTWKDQRGATRFASVITRNVSEHGVYVECQSAVSIPMFRLVQFQLERDLRDANDLPVALKAGRVLSAVYRVSPGSTSGKPQCLALRLMVDPRKRMAEAPAEAARATA